MLMSVTPNGGIVGYIYLLRMNGRLIMYHTEFDTLHIYQPFIQTYKKKTSLTQSNSHPDHDSTRFLTSQ